MHLQVGVSALAVLVAQAAAQNHLFPIPFEHDYTICNGLSQPSWSACEDLFKSIDQDTFTLGPNAYDGESFQNENCTIRFVACSKSDESWELDYVMAGEIFDGVEKTCKEYDAGGGYRYSNACAVVESPRNPYVDRDAKDMSGEEHREEPYRAPDDMYVPRPDEGDDNEEGTNDNNGVAPGGGDDGNGVSLIEFAQRLHEFGEQIEEQPNADDGVDQASKRADGIKIAGHTKRDDCEECEEYEEKSIILNVRGPQEQVCDEVFQEGASCSKSRSITVTETFSVGMDMSVEFAKIINVGGSFSYSTSKATTEATAKTMVMSGCPNGGYFVWYPMMEITKGYCSTGEQCKEGGMCHILSKNKKACSASRPVEPAEGRISGEYDIQCR